MSDHASDSPLADASMVRHLLFTSASSNEITEILRTLAPASIDELRRQVRGMREMRERRVRPFGPPDWLFGPREDWLLCLLDKASEEGIVRALESVPELPPRGPWNEFRDLAMDLIVTPSRAQLRELMAADSRIGMPELHDVLSEIERRTDVIDAESGLMKSRARWLLWVLQRSRQVGYNQALDEAPPIAETARFGDDDPDLSVNWNVLSGAMAGYFNAYDRSGDIQDLERLTAHLSGHAVGEASVSEAVSLQQAGVRWMDRYTRIDEPAAFASAAELLRSAIARFPGQHIGAAYSRYMLADLYLRRWQQERSQQDAEEASRLLASAARDLPVDDGFWPGCMTRLGRLLLVRYEAQGDNEILAEGLAVIDLLCSAQRADLDTWLRGVSLQLQGLLDQLKSGVSAEARLSAVLDCVSEAVEQAESEAQTGAPEHLAAIGMRCREVSVRTADTRYLTAAIAVSRSILRLLPEDQEGWWSAAVHLSTDQVRQADDEPDPALLDEAFALLAKVMSQAPADWDGRIELLQSYAVAAASKFAMTAESQWAEAGLRAAREALSLAKQQARHVLVCTLTVARNLVAMHESTGSALHLDEAVSLLESAARLATQDYRSFTFNELGGALTRRFGLQGDIRDIDAAISAFETAVQASGPDAWKARRNLTFALMQRFVRTREPKWLNAGVDCAEEALIQASGSEANRALAMTDLAGTLFERYRRQNGDPADLQRCLQLSEEVLGIPGHLHRKTRFAAAIIYGSALRLRHVRGDGLAGDLDRAVEILEAALPQARGDIANGPRYLRDIARAYQDRYEMTGAPRDLERGITLYTESIDAAASLDPEVALDAALMLGRWSEGHGAWLIAASAYQSALKAAGRLVATQALRGHKESWLRDAQNLPSQAACALVRCGRLEEAVLALENGQALLLSEALEQGPQNAEQLRAEGHGAVADSYVRAEAQMSSLRDAQPAFASVSARRADQEQLRSTLSNALDEIVAVSGELIAPVTIREIARAAAEAPLCCVASNSWGGAALLVDQFGTIRHVPLPTLTIDAISEQFLAYIDAYQHRNLRPERWLSAIDKVTQWLWTSLMEPVVTSGHQALTMIPAGVLWNLPLHLAWRPAETPCGRRYALDDLLLAFAPNARVLNRTTSTYAQTILMVENPKSPAAPSLEYAREEAEGALQYFPGDRHELLFGMDATHAKVLDAFGSYDCLHFACHGQAQPGAPLDSALLLSDAELRLSDILTVRTTARLVVLSACETAVPGITLPDEIVGLPTGFLQAGATGVIGSLWTVPDKTTATLMTRFYQFWQDDGEPPAQALRHAQQQLRDEIAENLGPEKAHPYSWGAFTYMGR